MKPKKYLIPIAVIIILFNLILISCQSVPTEEIKIVESQTINGVTITIEKIVADAKRISFDYTIEGLPNVPNALDLFGNIQLIEKSGIGELDLGGYSRITRVDENSGVLKGSWSAIFIQPFSQSMASFDLFITLGDDSTGYDTNYVIASFPPSIDATPYPPNVFPPKLPENQIGVYHFEFETEISPMTVLTPHETVTVNGISMTLEKLEITTSFTTATLCYTKPSNADWMLARSSLVNPEQEALNNTYMLIFDTEYGVYQGDDALKIEDGRCVQLEFLLGHANQSAPIQLTIPSLEQSIPEAIPEDQIAIAREKLLPQGIDIGWQVTAFADGGGMSGPVYNQLPEGMSEEEAYQKFIEALGYVHQGPWEFTINP
jgi:hypothetical protein